MFKKESQGITNIELQKSRINVNKKIITAKLLTKARR